MPVRTDGGAAGHIQAMLLEKADKELIYLRMHPVIAVNESDILALRKQQAVIPRAAQSLVLLMQCHNAAVLLRVFIADRAAGIPGEPSSTRMIWRYLYVCAQSESTQCLRYGSTLYTGTMTVKSPGFFMKTTRFPYIDQCAERRHRSLMIKFLPLILF